MELQPGDRIAHYELVAKIGEGGMGVVWKAIDTRLDRAVALKLLRGACDPDPACLDRLDREARALAAVRHPGIVTIYSVEQAGDYRFITMEHVAGRTLAHVVPETGLPLSTFFDLAELLVDAVRAAHAEGITHRDLKPSNVIVTDAGEIKVLDFGIAASLKARAAPDAPTVEAPTGGVLFGTPPFIAPEVLLGHGTDHRADLFSLGGVLYFMLAGREPFTGDSLPAVVASVLRDTPTAIEVVRPEVPPAVGAAVVRCLAKRPEERFQTAAQLMDALAEVRRDEAVTSRQPVRSIAVLPFDDLSSEKDQDYFCEGIAGEIVLSLAKIRGLRVASRSAALFAKKRYRDHRELAAQLGVDALLEGSIRKAGTRLRITVELTDVGSESQIWAERYDRELQDIFAIQDDIAARVADALCCRLTQIERHALRQRPTPQVHAYDLYLRGRKFLEQYSRKGAEFGCRLFAEALEVEPDYARAHAGIAASHAFLYLYGGRHPDDLARAETASAQAVALAPDAAEAHAARGIALSLAHGYDEASREFEAAIRLNPELFDAHYYYARTSFAAGRFEEAIALWERASALRPDDYQSPLLVAQAYEQLGRVDDAQAARRRGVRVAQEHVRLYPDDARALYMGANGLVALGHVEEGLDWARQSLALDPEEPMLLYNIGCIYALAGRPAEAIDCLERAVAHGLAQREWLVHDTNLDPLRTLPRFQQLMASFVVPASG